MKKPEFEIERIMNIACKFCGTKYEEWVFDGKRECSSGHSSHKFRDILTEKQDLESIKV